MSVRLSGPRRRGTLPAPDRRQLRRRAQSLLDALGCREAELSVALADDAEIAALNERYRGKARPTDVLSFSLLEGPHAARRGALLGDVVLGVEVAARQAARARRSLDDELARLLIHGVLHLLGHDHRRAAQRARMRREERRLWERLGA
jgi:probable rRNA maturation factor